MDANLLLALVATGLSLTYGIFMIVYLSHAKKCDKYSSEQDQTFRKVALIITWIEVILVGLYALMIIIALLSGSSLSNNYIIY